ncbi:MAG: hypothetical protein J0H59_17420 [Comamonadaceae bacterium]|nr:hypothetical protein [Comamonadaceae bacterium]
MTESEALVLDELAWSLAEPVPPRMSQYVEALRAYAEDVGVYFDEKALVRKFSGQSLDVEYTIWVREEVGGDWLPLKKSVFCVSKNGRLIWSCCTNFMLLLLMICQARTIISLRVFILSGRIPRAACLSIRCGLGVETGVVGFAIAWSMG